MKRMTVRLRTTRVGLAIALAVSLVGGGFLALRSINQITRTHVVGYFANSNGLYVGDDVRIMGVRVGKVDKIEPQPQRAKVSFWYDSKYKLPADAKAVILSPSLVAVRAIQLTPVYTAGPALSDHAVIPQDRTAVPVEWDDLREQLQKLTETLQPTQRGGVSTLGEFVNTAADNLRGRGQDIRDTVIKVSQAYSVLGDHSTDLFSTVKNVSIVVSALRDSTDVMRQLNQNLAAVTALIASDHDAVGNAVADLNNVVGDVTTFVADNRESLGTTSERLASITDALNQSLDDIKQTLHIGPTTFQNFLNIYNPAQGALTGILAANNFANPISFFCGAVQAASRLGAEQSAKLCVQYLAPIIKNRQYNFFPLGVNPFVGASARPNELTYSEDWLRPDYVPPPGPGSVAPQANAPAPSGGPPAAGAPVLPPAPETPLAAETRPTAPADGLKGIMVPPGSGS